MGFLLWLFRCLAAELRADPLAQSRDDGVDQGLRLGCPERGDRLVAYRIVHHQQRAQLAEDGRVRRADPRRPSPSSARAPRRRPPRPPLERWRRHRPSRQLAAAPRALRRPLRLLQLCKLVLSIFQEFSDFL